jgi:RNA polymerase sigma-70 factor (ECF subfamily)
MASGIGVDISHARSTLTDMNVLTDNPSRALGADERRFVYAVVRRIVGSDADAEDVAQDALLLAYRHLASFRGEARFRTWLYRIATTTALGHLRRTRRARLHVPADELRLADPAKTADAALAEAELDALVRRAVDALDPPYRDVLRLRADANEAEAAAQLGISVANVKIRAHRARKQLRDALAGEVDVATGMAA